MYLWVSSVQEPVRLLVYKTYQCLDYILILYTNISQGSVIKRLRFAEIFNDRFIVNLLQSLSGMVPVKDFLKKTKLQRLGNAVY